MSKATSEVNRSSSSRWIAFISFSLLFTINVSWIRQNPWYDLPPKPYSDGPDYEAIGWGIYSGLGLATHLGNHEWQSAYLQSHPILYHDWSAKTGPIVPRTDRPPFLSVVIAGIYGLFGVNETAYIAVRIFLAACLSAAGAIAILLSHRCTEWMLQHRTFTALSPSIKQTLPVFSALACFVLALFDSNVRRYMEDFLTELPALALTQLFIAVSLLALRRPQSRGWLVVSGLVFGLMIYDRSLFVAWLPGLFVLWVILVRTESRTLQVSSKRWRRLLDRVSRAAIPILVAIVVVAPWSIRNCLILQQFMPLGTKGPITMMGGYCDAAYQQQGNWSNEPERYWRKILEQSFGDQLASSTEANLLLELELVSIAKREVRQWIGTNLAKLPTLVMKRLYSHFNPYNGLSGLVKLVAIIGVLLSLKYLPRESIFMLGLVMINASCVAAMYSVGGRFFVPLYGVMYLFCAQGCTCAAALVLRLVSKPAI